MAEYQVVCVERKPAAGHHHIVGIGVRRSGKTLERRSVKDVRRAIKNKEDSFYTIDTTTGEKVVVSRHKCCGEKTIASVPRGSETDNLAGLTSCSRLMWFMVR
ncbi:MAG TPA: DUF3892 domain-containing protein [Acidimicrobiales bacterium]|nr:DUF3892 domain-containing protein [Acidimicrobiales bacterium]